MINPIIKGIEIKPGYVIIIKKDYYEKDDYGILVVFPMSDKQYAFVRYDRDSCWDYLKNLDTKDILEIRMPPVEGESIDKGEILYKIPERKEVLLSEIAALYGVSPENLIIKEG